MKHSADKDAMIIRSVKDDVLPLFNAPKSRMDRSARTSLRRLRNANKAFDKIVEINLSLLTAPHVVRVVDDICEIKFCQDRKPISAQAVRLPFVSTLL